MRTYDFSPLYRSTVGFDRLFDMLDQTGRESAPNWPPYNIERISEDDYRITMALAGFAPDEIELVQKENTLFVGGHKNTDQEQGAEVLHRGIATRPFRQSFDLAEHVKVVGASFENGLLIVELKREVPEALKPRRIAIAAGEGQGTRTNVTTLDQSKNSLSPWSDALTSPHPSVTVSARPRGQPSRGKLLPGQCRICSSVTSNSSARYLQMRSEL